MEDEAVLDMRVAFEIGGLRMCNKCGKRMSPMTKCEKTARYHIDMFSKEDEEEEQKKKQKRSTVAEESN